MSHETLEPVGPAASPAETYDPEVAIPAVPQAGDNQTHEGVQRLITYGPGTPQFAAFMSR